MGRKADFSHSMLDELKIWVQESQRKLKHNIAIDFKDEKLLKINTVVCGHCNEDMVDDAIYVINTN